MDGHLHVIYSLLERFFFSLREKHLTGKSSKHITARKHIQVRLHVLQRADVVLIGIYTDLYGTKTT